MESGSSQAGVLNLLKISESSIKLHFVAYSITHSPIFKCLLSLGLLQDRRRKIQVETLCHEALRKFLHFLSPILPAWNFLFLVLHYCKMSSRRRENMFSTILGYDQKENIPAQFSSKYDKIHVCFVNSGRLTCILKLRVKIIRFIFEFVYYNMSGSGIQTLLHLI